MNKNILLLIDNVMSLNIDMISDTVNNMRPNDAVHEVMYQQDVKTVNDSLDMLRGVLETLRNLNP